MEGYFLETPDKMMQKNILFAQEHFCKKEKLEDQPLGHRKESNNERWHRKMHRGKNEH